MDQQLQLRRDKYFASFFTLQFFGALNDNLFKTALVVLLAYGGIETGEMNPAVLVSLAAAIFILPFILLSPLAGQLAERYPKTILTRWIKLAEILIAALGVVALYTSSPILSLTTLGLFGAQSALFSPCKYSLLPELLKPEQLIAGNGLISGGTYIAILCGTILGAIFITGTNGILIVSLLLLVFSLIGYAASLMLPQSQIYDSDFRVARSPLRHMKQMVTAIRVQDKKIILAIFGIAWFYFIAATFHAQFPNFAKETLAVNSHVLALFMAIFSIGIGAGSMLNHLILSGRTRTTWVPYMTLGIALFSADLYMASVSVEPGTKQLRDIPSFLSTMSGWRITLDLLCLSIVGGLYIVPLRAFVQGGTDPAQRGRIMAGGAMLDAIAIFSSAILAAALLAIGLRVIDLFLILSLATLASVFILARLEPDLWLAQLLTRKKDR